MNTVHTLGAAALATILLTATIAAAQPAGALRIVVKDTHYLIGTMAFDDLDALERRVRGMAPRSIGLTACGPGSGRALTAAVHRFNRLALGIEVVDADAAPCRASAAGFQVGRRGGPRPHGIDDAAVADYWRGVTP